MEISNIIKSASDRLFIIDRECYIIFTGYSTEDEQPFIRIGNYIDFPVKLIPFIENIVIPDTIIGNPALEQFNIDVQNLSTNRYIGSNNIVQRYLNFQKAFELDLKNATIVDVEKDIPDISREHLISYRDSFLGIFYTNGNFRIVHDKKDIASLEDMDGLFDRHSAIHDQLSQKHSETKRYKGRGLLFLDGNPLFYSKGYFTAYQFPKGYYQDFNRLSIDPARIREVLLPSSNFIHATKFFKWLNNRNGKIKLFCDYKEESTLIERMFKDATILKNNFSGLSLNTGDGLSIKNYKDTFNLKATYRQDGAEITIAYIKGLFGIENILRDKLDCIIINYSVYEDANLYFKSVQIPVLIADDGNPNVRKLNISSLIILNSKIQYEIKKISSRESLLSEISSHFVPSEVITALSDSDTDALNNHIVQARQDDDTQLKRLINIESTIKIFLDETTNRKFSVQLTKLLSDISSTLNHSATLISGTALLLFHNGCAYRFFSQTTFKDDNYPEEFFDEILESDQERFNTIPDINKRELYKRIITDRQRLRDLLALFTTRHNSHELGQLAEKISERKKHYFADTVEEVNREISNAHKKDRLKIILKRIPAVLILICLIIFASVKGLNYYDEFKKQEKMEQIRQTREKLIRDYSIKVSDVEIYYYANQVALNNGYTRITLSKLKQKNPNWIFPGNVFTMLDDEQVTVREGNTLWGLSYRKIMARKIKFYTIIEKIKAHLRAGTDISDDIARANKLDLTEKQKKLLNELTGKE